MSGGCLKQGIPLLTIIVPTFNEGNNPVILAQGVCEAMKEVSDHDFELLFVDDSTDETPQVLERLSRENPRVRFIHREKERGLGTALVRGFHEARGEWVAVMDGDLQHPPSLLPRMLAQAGEGTALVVPSRFIPGGSDGGLFLHRKLVSLVARGLAWLLLPRTRAFSDPTGGVFLLRKEVLSGWSFDGGSWKILIEIMVRGHFSRAAEIPYHFRARDLGTSKMTAAAQIDYIRHLLRLRKTGGQDSLPPVSVKRIAPSPEGPKK